MGGSRDGAWPAQLPRSPELAKDPHASGALALVPLVSNTWYVDAQAAPPGNGSSASPYASIQYALDQPTTVHGDLLLVAPGVYVENLALSKSVRIRATGAELDETVLRAASPGAVVTSTAFQGAGGTPALEGWTIDGLGNASGFGATLVGSDSFLRLEHCIVRGFTSGDAIHQTEFSYFELLRCTITGNQVGLRGFESVNSGLISLIGTIVSGNAIDATFAPDVYICYASCVPSALLSTGTHNFSGVPGFWKPAALDYHLAPLSPCIDAGIHAALPPDPDGSVADVGAFTYDPEYAATPTTYCTPKLTSLACTPVIAWSGTASLSGPDDFHLVAAPVLNQKFGLYIWGASPQAAPFFGGTLCVEPPFVRGSGLTSGGSPIGNDCTGAYNWHFSQAYMALKGLTAGDILYAQAWGRDPGFAPPNNSQLSNAIVFRIGAVDRDSKESWNENLLARRRDCVETDGEGRACGFAARARAESHGRPARRSLLACSARGRDGAEARPTQAHELFSNSAASQAQRLCSWPSCRLET